MPIEDKRKNKVRTDRLRRMAERQGLVLIKSRTKDPRAKRYGRVHLFEDIVEGGNVLIYGGDLGYTLDEVEKVLTWDVDVRRSVGRRKA